MSFGNGANIALHVKPISRYTTKNIGSKYPEMAAGDIRKTAPSPYALRPT